MRGYMHQGTKVQGAKVSFARGPVIFGKHYYISNLGTIAQNVNVNFYFGNNGSKPETTIDVWYP